MHSLLKPIYVLIVYILLVNKVIYIYIYICTFITKFCSEIPCSSVSHFVETSGDSRNRLQIVLHVLHVSICMYIYVPLCMCV